MIDPRIVSVALGLGTFLAYVASILFVPSGLLLVGWIVVAAGLVILEDV